MQAQVTFYLLADSIPYPEQIAPLIADLWQPKTRLYLYCANAENAKQWDDWLWHYPEQRFIPHQIGSSQHVPVEIGWHGPRNRYQILINLNFGEQMPPFAADFKQIIEFVPATEAEKIAARKRYQQYKALGIYPNYLELRVDGKRANPHELRSAK